MLRANEHAVVRCLLVALLARADVGAADFENVATIGSLPRSSIASRPRAVLHGQVISLRQSGDGPDAIIEDASGGIRVVGIDRASMEPADTGTGGPAVGDILEVQGHAESDGQSVVLRAERITVSGSEPLPPPRRCDIESFFAGAEDCRLIEVEGIVEQAWHAASETHFEIAAAGRRFTARVADAVAAGNPELGGDPQQLVDALVRLAGTGSSECNQRGEIVRPVLHVERSGWFTVVEPRKSPVFKNAAVTPDAIGRPHGETSIGHRVRTFGQVIHAVSGETLFLQNGHAGVRVGLARGAVGSDERFVPGDTVEVAGFLDRSGRVVGIRNASVTRIDSAPSPAPLVATPAAILDANAAFPGTGPGDYDGCLVRFAGRLLQSQPTNDGGVLLLRCDDLIVTAEADRATFAAIAPTEPESFVEVTGVATVDRGSARGTVGAEPRRLRLILRDTGDFRVLRSPSWWTPGRLLASLGTTGAVLATALAWVATLRRQLGVQKRLLAAEMRSRRDAAIEFETTLRERNRLAANLHDTLQQTIGGIGFQLDACEAAGGGPTPEVRRHFTVARQMVSHAAKELQGSVWAMRSLPLEGKPFAEALSAVVSRVGEGHDVELAVRTEGTFADLPEFVSGNVLLLVQEAVHNALKHGGPKRIEVTVSDDTAGGTLRARVTDDGRGFAVGTQAGPSEGHFGLRGMRERAERLGGSLVVTSRPGVGTTVEAMVQRRDYDAEISMRAPCRR